MNILIPCQLIKYIASILKLLRVVKGKFELCVFKFNITKRYIYMYLTITTVFFMKSRFMTYKVLLGLVPVNVKDTTNKVNIKLSYFWYTNKCKIGQIKRLNYCFALNKLFLGFEEFCVWCRKICNVYLYRVGLCCMPRRQPLWWSTISSWLLTWLTVLLCLRDSPPSVQKPTGETLLAL